MISMQTIIGQPWSGMKPKAAKQIKEAAKYAAETAVREYVLMRQPNRFKRAAFASHHFKPRGKYYTWKKSNTPYVGPRGNIQQAMETIKRFSDAQASGSASGLMISLAAAARETLKQEGRPHMRDLVRKEHSPKARMSAGNIGVELRQPGARILNRTWKIYRYQFTQLARGGDLRWLVERTRAHFTARLRSLINSRSA